MMMYRRLLVSFGLTLLFSILLFLLLGWTFLHHLPQKTVRHMSLPIQVMIDPITIPPANPKPIHNYPQPHKSIKPSPPPKPQAQRPLPTRSPQKETLKPLNKSIKPIQKEKPLPKVAKSQTTSVAKKTPQHHRRQRFKHSPLQPSSPKPSRSHWQSKPPKPPKPSLPQKAQTATPLSPLARALGTPAPSLRPQSPNMIAKTLSHRSIDQVINQLYQDSFQTFSKNQKAFIQNNLFKIQIITQRYLLMHGYPPLAARQKIGGRNIVEFYLWPNGDITNLHIISSSGYDMLDDNSLETILDAYKEYPLPKEKTKIRFYIHYIIR